MLKKTKLVLGIIFVAQAISFIVLFFALYGKKKNFANTLIALAAAGSVAGGWLLLSAYKDSASNKKALTMDACCDFSEDDDLFGEDFDEDLVKMPGRDD